MIWGKVIGAILGLALGHSPLGMVIGVIIGHWVDRKLFKPAPAKPVNRRQQIFSTSVVILAAKLAKADGTVTREEVDAFKAQFRIPPAQMGDVAALYDKAKQDPGGYEIHARTLAATFPGETRLLAEVLAALHRIALADGALHPAERAFLEHVGGIFGLSGQSFADHLSGLADDDPYTVLGVERAAPMPEIKAAWRQLTREHHPDGLMAKGMPAEYIDLATRKMAAINAAYDAIRSQRGES